jgi:hypothetical protein
LDALELDQRLIGGRWYAETLSGLLGEVEEDGADGQACGRQSSGGRADAVRSTADASQPVPFEWEAKGRMSKKYSLDRQVLVVLVPALSACAPSAGRTHAYVCTNGAYVGAYAGGNGICIGVNGAFGGAHGVYAGMNNRAGGKRGWAGGESTGE